ncbi:MAG: phospholipase A2 [Bacteroidia bacterium]|nr:phospholipase A2 [Bacteroidia bacterium]
MKNSMRNFSMAFLCLFLIGIFQPIQAQYTRSMYDKNGKKVLTFSIPKPIETNCSSDAAPAMVKNGFAKDIKFYDALFAKACESHDYGWSAAPWQKAGFPGLEGKKIADERFRVDMQQACDARFKSVFDAARKAACYGAAEIYFSAVYNKVDPDWNSKQARFTRNRDVKVIHSSSSRWSPKVTTSTFNVWGVNKNNDIFIRKNNNWSRVSGKLKDVSIGSDGTVWGVNANDDIFKRKNNQWVKVTGKLKQISVGNGNNVWGVNKSNQIYKRSGNGWVKIYGSLKHVAAAADGTVWGVNSAGHIYRYNGGSSWTKMAGNLKMISVGSRRHIWGVNNSGYVYKWTGSRWTKMPGKLKNVSVAADGTVWGVNDSDQIFKWNGSRWIVVKGKLIDLEVMKK